MLIAILSGAVCLIISIILFTPMFRHFTILRPRRETLSKSRKRNRTKSRHHIDINNRPDD